MRRSIATAMLAACLIVLAGCGQKGALFLPDEQRNTVVTPVAPAPAEAAPAAPAAPDDDDPESPRRSNTPPPAN